MLEKIVGLKKMNILQCQEFAKKIGFDSATFDLCGPKGSIPCQWLDAYMGMFTTIADREHFMVTSQFQFNSDVWCINLMPKISDNQSVQPTS